MIELFSGSIVQRYLFQLPFCFVKIEQLNIFYRNCYETKYARRNKNALQAFQLLEDLLSQSAIFDIIKNELLLIFSSRHFSYWFFVCVFFAQIFVSVQYELLLTTNYYCCCCCIVVSISTRNTIKFDSHSGFFLFFFVTFKQKNDTFLPLFYAKKFLHLNCSQFTLVCTIGFNVQN